MGQVALDSFCWRDLNSRRHQAFKPFFIHWLYEAVGYGACLCCPSLDEAKGLAGPQQSIFKNHQVGVELDWIRGT